MPLSIRTGVSPQSFGISKASSPFPLAPPPSLKTGKVMGVVTTKDTPTPTQFSRAGNYGGMGSIFFLNYDNAKNIDPQNSDTFLDICDIAIPLFPNVSYPPLLGELVYIIEGLPSPSAQISSGATQKYYISTINLWGNIQTNSQTLDSKAPLGKTFIENSNIKKLLSFEGDYIIQGRKGNSIRFSTTVRPLSANTNEWSNINDEGYPITIISNGHAYDPTKQFYIESIDNDASSIYLTSNQSIPLSVSTKFPINPFTTPKSVSNYTDSQVLINADRIVLNSKKDDIMLFSSSNIELNTNNIINLNAGNYIHFNVKESNPATTLIPSPKILLGTTINNKFPIEPLLLGKQTTDFLLTLLSALDAFALSLTPTSTNAAGSPLAKIQGSSEELVSKLKPLYDKIQTLTSKSTFTI
jgi:hypothetical protein